MTRIQRRLLLAMQTMSERGEPFTFQRLCDASGRTSKGTTHRTLGVLVDLGHVRRVRVGAKRSVYEVVRPVESRVQYFVWDDGRKALRERGDYDNAPTDPHHGGKIWQSS